MSPRILKAGLATTIPPLTAGRVIIKRELYDAHAEAERLIGEAKAIAARIQADAEAARDRTLEEARKQGYEDGLAEWNQIVADTRRQKEQYLAASEQDLLRLAVKIAGKIIGEQLRLEPDTITSIVREALKSAPREQRLTVQVNPADADAVKRQIRRLAEASTFQAPEIAVVPVESVAAGGCVIVSELGRVDARLETQLQCMERLLLHSRR